MAEFTLCWDCKKSNGGCDWSREFIPIKGWDATPTVKKEFESFLIRTCPEFERGSWEAGRFRTRKEYVEAMIKARRKDEIIDE